MPETLNLYKFSPINGCISIEVIMLKAKSLSVSGKQSAVGSQGLAVNSKRLAVRGMQLPQTADRKPQNKCMVSPELKKMLEMQKYEFAGAHSAVKVCSWTKKSLTDDGVCYKEKFYGIRSHRCCQMTPSVGYCQNKCIFCWRPVEFTEGIEMKGEVDSPKDIVDGCLKGQKHQLAGYGGFHRTNKKKYAESVEPMHFAISLSGEPTAYPRLNELIKEIHSRGKSTFVVSNGMLPERIMEIEPPTQLYLSVDAPDENLFREIDRCALKDGWQRLMQSLDALKVLREKTRTAIRITMIKDKNMVMPEQYAELIRRASPMFVEVKAYMFVGASRERLQIGNMPFHDEVKAFAQEIGKHCGYKIIDEQPESRVVLMMEKDFPGRIMKF